MDMDVERTIRLGMRMVRTYSTPPSFGRHVHLCAVRARFWRLAAARAPFTPHVRDAFPFAAVSDQHALGCTIGNTAGAQRSARLQAKGNALTNEHTRQVE